MRILILFFFTGITFGQQLHRQMLSASGQVVTTPKGIKVSQTIAQQSATGTSIKKGVFVSQGFQQSNRKAAVALNEMPFNETTVFPNPISDYINFKMTIPVEGKIAFSLFDVQGKRIVYQEKEAIDQVLTITNLALAAGKYFVKLEGNKYSFRTTILKSK